MKGKMALEKNLTSVSYVSEKVGAGIGGIVGVDTTNHSSKKIGEASTKKVGTSNREYCWSCSRHFVLL